MAPIPKFICCLLYFCKAKRLLNKRSENPKLRLCWHPWCQNYCGGNLSGLWMAFSSKSTTLPAALIANGIHQIRWSIVPVQFLPCPNCCNHQALLDTYWQPADYFRAVFLLAGLVGQAVQEHKWLCTNQLRSSPTDAGPGQARPNKPSQTCSGSV